MSNRTQLLAQLRRELGDLVAPYQWTDDFLTDKLLESVPWYSRLFPQKSVAYRDVVANQRTFTVGETIFKVVRVECPTGTPVPQEASALVAAPQATGYRQAWAVWGGTLYLRNAASGDEVGLNKLAMHVQIGWDRLDPVLDWGGPEEDERLLVMYAVAEAWAWLDGSNLRRGRVASHSYQVKRAQDRLADELKKRQRQASSREMEAER